MKKTGILIISALILLFLGGVVSGDTAAAVPQGTLTNVVFCKMNSAGTSYDFIPMVTLYTGENDYGKLTFITGSDKITAGNYAIVQQTPNGLQLIKSFTINPHGNVTGFRTFMRFALTKDQLVVPLAAITGQDSATPAAKAPLTSAPSAEGTNPVPTVTSQAAPMASTPAKSPVSLPVILAGAGIAGIICIPKMRR
jgi:hypothetical protein